MSDLLKELLQKKELTTPDMWQLAVEMWLNHIENRYCERSLLTALEVGQGEPGAAVDWLLANNYASLLGNFGYSDGRVHIDVGGSLKASDFIKVFYPNWNHLIFKITLIEVLNYLADNKKVAVQLSLL